MSKKAAGLKSPQSPRSLMLLAPGMAKQRLLQPWGHPRLRVQNHRSACVGQDAPTSTRSSPAPSLSKVTAWLYVFASFLKSQDFSLSRLTVMIRHERVGFLPRSRLLYKINACPFYHITTTTIITTWVIITKINREMKYLRIGGEMCKKVVIHTCSATKGSRLISNWLFISCVTMERLVNISELQFSHLQNGDNSVTYIIVPL